jgi:hypothetical protein
MALEAVLKSPSFHTFDRFARIGLSKKCGKVGFDFLVWRA